MDIFVNMNPSFPKQFIDEFFVVVKMEHVIIHT